MRMIEMLSLLKAVIFLRKNRPSYFLAEEKPILFSHKRWLFDLKNWGSFLATDTEVADLQDARLQIYCNTRRAKPILMCMEELHMTATFRFCCKKGVPIFQIKQPLFREKKDRFVPSYESLFFFRRSTWKRWHRSISS